MATTSFATAIADGTWTEIYDGAAAAKVGITNGGMPDDPHGLMLIYIGASAPDGNTTDFFPLKPSDDVAVNVASGDLIYGLGYGKTVARGYVEGA